MIPIMIDDDVIQLNSVELSTGLLTVWLNSASGIGNLAHMRANKTNNDNDGDDDDIIIIMSVHVVIVSKEPKSECSVVVRPFLSKAAFLTSLRPSG